PRSRTTWRRSAACCRTWISEPSPALSTRRVAERSITSVPAPSAMLSSSSAAARRKAARASSPSVTGAAMTRSAVFAGSMITTVWYHGPGSKGEYSRNEARLVDRASLTALSKGLGLGNVGGLKAFRAFPHLELDVVVFLQRPEPVRLDGRIVDKNIGAAVALDETEAFRVIEPLDPAGDAGHTFTRSLYEDRVKKPRRLYQPIRKASTPPNALRERP